MRTLLSCLLIAFLFSLANAELKIGRISSNDQVNVQQLRDLGAHVMSDESVQFIDIIFDNSAETNIISAGYLISDIHPISKTGLTDIDPEYHTYEEYTEELQKLASNYPDLCKLDSIGRAEQFERTIWCMKLSDNPQVEEDETALLYVGIHHACEVMGGETIMYMINLFLESYGTDPEITFWLDNYEIFFVPLVNPDGHFAVIDSISLFWRKNANDTNNNGIFYEVWGGAWWNDDTDGVDLNRNYDWYWDQGGLGDPLSYYYRGESAFSEHENQSIRNLSLEQKFLSVVSFHSYGEVVICPWNFNGEPSPDQDVINEFGLGIAFGIEAEEGGFYDTTIYEAQSGQCRNWHYGVIGTLGFCVEVNQYPTFIPPGEEVEERAQNYYNGVKYCLERANKAGITGRITDSVTGEPIAAQVTIDSPYNNQVEPRYADEEFGRFTRMLKRGQDYIIMVEHPDYLPFASPFTTLSDTLLVFDIELEAVNSVEDLSDGILPDSHNLDFGCSPNPFNASTNVNFIFASSGQAEVTVHDLQGREVEKLFIGQLNPGTHNFVWNAQNLSSGIYFIRLKFADNSYALKTVLMK